jgi:hypothetical protein
MGNASALCGKARLVYLAFMACACSGACQSVCANNYCADPTQTTTTCLSCFYAADPNGCDDELNACETN